MSALGQKRTLARWICSGGEGSENALRGLKEWQRLVPKSAARRVDYLDFWYRLSSLSTPIPGTDVLPVP
jgi:hypothetical protein